MEKGWKGLMVVVTLMLLCVLWVAQKQSGDIVELATAIEKSESSVKGLEAELKRADEAMEIKLQNETTLRDHANQLIVEQIANIMPSIDNLATGIREMRTELSMHREGHENLATGARTAAAATVALTETEAKVATVERAVRELIVKLEEARRADAGQATGTATTVLSSEDRVLSSIEVANIVDRLEKELTVLKQKLAEAQTTQEEILRNQAKEAEEDK